MCEEWSSTYQMLSFSSPEGLRGHSLPRDHSRLLALTHAWQHLPLAVIPGVGIEPWKGALCQLEEGANRKQMRHSGTPAKAQLPVSALLLEGNTDPADRRCSSLTTVVRTEMSEINSLPFKTKEQAEV